jgi:hypothetical protein
MSSQYPPLLSGETALELVMGEAVAGGEVGRSVVEVVDVE